MEARILEVRRSVLRRNDLLAHALRQRFRRAGVFVVELVSAPGAGKTALLERTIAALKPLYRVAALTGDPATERDARRLAATGVRVEQIATGAVSHLDAEMLGRTLERWDLDALDLLFVENVGNLVCPADYDLGANLRVALFPATDGADTPLKYPAIFQGADLALLSKMDLAPATGFRRREAFRNLQRAHPGLLVLETSAASGLGLPGWYTRIAALAREICGMPPVPPACDGASLLGSV